MLQGVWGRKIGMTQLFTETAVVPVTVIDVNRWVITQIKTKERDGYFAVQVGLIRDKFADKAFEQAWLKKQKQYFAFVKEIPVDVLPEGLQAGQPFDYSSTVKVGQKVDVTGNSKGRGFAGVVKRHGFSGGGASHGSCLGRRPGSLSFLRSQGRVIKGKKLPGHFGTTQHTITKMNVVMVEPATGIVCVAGAVPGGKGSLVFLHNV